jgi:hypothetical protein
MQIDQHLLRESPSVGYMKGKRNLISRVTNPQERQARTTNLEIQHLQILERKESKSMHNRYI